VYKRQLYSQQTISLDYDYALYDVTINNKSGAELEISVIDKKTNEQYRGFGLNSFGKATVMVERNGALIIFNNSDKDAKINLTATKKEAVTSIADNATYISFTLHNTSLESIPLWIPGVMNPNLSPKSKSGVDLKMGQEIFFKYKGKKQTLLVVDESIEHKAVIDVPELIKSRKKEIDAQ